MNKVRYGLIGIGNQGSAYAKFLTTAEADAQNGPFCPESSALGALCDIDPEKMNKCKELYPDVPFFENWQDMVNSDCCDAFILTVPHYLHPEMAIYCIEHGKAVLCEKPAGVDAMSVSKMNACAEAHPEVPFAIMFNQRTNSLYRKIREIVKSGDLGEIRRSNWIINTWWRPMNYYLSSDWRATWGGEGGGVLVNQAPHQLDLWQWICGVPSKVYAKIIFGAHRDIVVDNDVTIVTEYDNGATGSFITCTHDACGTDRLEIDFDKGKIVVENSRHAKVYRMKDSEQELNNKLTMQELSALLQSNQGDKLYTVEEFEYPDKWGFQHIEVIDNFSRHVLYGEDLLAPGEEGINGVRLANSALLSAWLGKEVLHPCDERLFVEELNKRIKEEGKWPERDL